MKTTKRALFSSVIALILCFSMLVGTTFAWFTDSVESGVNQIIAGNLDVEVYYDNNGTQESIEGKNSVLFDGIKWEPGVVAYENITVKNLGNLALKYQLSINFDNATPAKNGKTLTDALQVAIVENGVSGYTNDAAGRAKLISECSFAPMDSVMQAGELKLQDEEKTYGIVIWWEPTDHDNDFNMNNENRGEELSIDLGIKLVATQLDAEFDSFGPDYDEDAIYTDFTVTSEAELKEALANGKDDMIIGIKGNVTWTTGAGIGSTPFVGEDSSIKKITLLGIGEDATFTATGSGVGDIGIDNGTVIFKNLKIADESVSYAENSWEYGYLEFRGNTVFENCDIVNAIMMEGDSASFKNCSFNSHKDSEYAVWVSNGDATFENCTFTGTRGLKMHEAYGSEVGTVVINNNTFIDLSKKPGLAIGTVNADTTVVLTNNEFIGTQAGDQGLYSYETDTDVATFNFTYENNKVFAQDSSLPQGLYKVDENTWLASNANALSQGIAKAEDGQTVVLAQDVIYTGNGYANIVKNITLDLNGNTLSTTSLGVVAKAGTIKNGTISNPVGARAALRTWSGVSVENVIIEAPLNGGITVAGGNSLPYIKNVTINAKTYGIELQYGASVKTIENVNIVAGENGIVVQAGTIGKITNSVIKGGNAGIYGQLKGVNDLSITLDGTSEVHGDKYGIFLCDEGATIVPDGSAYLTYDEATTFEGGLNAQEFAFGQPGKLVINGVRNVTNAENLAEGLKNGDTVVLTDDIQTEAATTAPYGNKYAFKMDGGVLDGNGKELYMECYGDDYGIMTSGGTVKNLTITEGCRAIMIMYATEDIILDNVKIGGDGVLYPINTGEYAKVAGVDLIVTNSTLAGWTSYAGIESASFTNVKFEQGTYYNNIYGRVFKPYVNTTMTDCSFVEHMNLDLSGLVQGQKITFVNCTVNGKAVTADVLTIPTTDAQYDTELFTVDLPSWATSINDCIVFG